MPANATLALINREGNFNSEVHMRCFAIICCAALVAACARTEQAADTAMGATAMAMPAPTPIALTDVAGKWSGRSTNEAGDSVLATYVITATANTTGWTMTFPNRRPVPVRVLSVAGDSIVIAAGPYESVLRKGVQVRTESTMRIRDGKLVGTGVARYSVRTADSVRTFRLEATRAP